ncbi:SpaH/EbpB family LPXTG-anchored major pilin [Enterococcus malodoratus]|uniref:SpaH/EbpB family LPXTG-anchored major pilin n=1 Tax=Enterococcus malodoratus TaxID=71451 RepID=UPI003FD118FA
MKNKKKWISKAAVSLSLLTMFGGVAVSAGSSAVYAAQTISTNPTSDDATARSITLWKYEIKSGAELGERGDGLELSGTAPELAGKTVMEDVWFEIVRVKLNAGKELTDPLKQKEGAGNDYTIDTSFPSAANAGKNKAKTDANGKLTFDVSLLLDITGATGHKKADGIYLIKEIPNPNTGKYDYTVAAEGPNTYRDPADGNKIKKEISTPMSPFFAWLPQTKRVKDPANPGQYISSGELIYDVHVQPKNIVTDSELDKTVNGGKGYSIKAGQNFQWEAKTKLPDGLYFKADKDMTIINRHDKNGLPIADLDVLAGTEVYADYYYVHDELAKELHLDDVEVQFYNPNTSAWDTMTLNNEYEVYKNGNGTKEAAGPITDGVTATTDIRVELTQAGMKKIEELTTKRYSDIRVIYKTHTEVDFNGIIENKYDTGYLIPGQKPKTDESKNNPEYYDGGFNIKKVTEAGADLEGAEFHIALTEEDAEKEIFLADDGKAYPKGTPGVNFLTSKSDASGNAKFDGLKLDWYTDDDGDKEQDPTNPAENTWPKTESTPGADYIHKSYWVVETKSPAGYELLKTPQEVKVDLYTHDNAGPELTVENKSKTDLPFTGGTGTMLMIIIAIGAITIGTAAIAIDKKRRHA